MLLVMNLRSRRFHKNEYSSFFNVANDIMNSCFLRENIS